MAGNPRFARHVALAAVGLAGQAALGRASAAIIGVGGLGCPAALYLANSGLGQLVLNDFDRVDESNLPRQILFRDTDVGSPKVLAAAARLTQTAPDTKVEPIHERLSAERLLEVVAAVDVILDCTDNYQSRLATNLACVATNTPLVSGAAIRMEGQLVTFAAPGQGPCYRCVYREEDELLGDCEGNGVLAPVPGVIGAMMATETIKLITSTEPNPTKLIIWDGMTNDWRSLNVKRDEQCPTCGGS
jgi:molybdopterin/thiamine biosynthesis adenylyltransferase